MTAESKEHHEAIQKKVNEGYSTNGIWKALRDLALKCEPKENGLSPDPEDFKWINGKGFGMLPDFWKIEGNLFVWGEVIWQSNFLFNRQKRISLYCLKEWIDDLQLDGKWIEDHFISIDIATGIENEFNPYDFFNDYYSSLRSNHDRARIGHTEKHS